MTGPLVSSDPKLQHIPIIFLTAIDDAQSRIEGQKCGGDDYLAKPFDLDALELRIKAQLKRMSKDDLVGKIEEILDIPEPGGFLAKLDMDELSKKLMEKYTPYRFVEGTNRYMQLTQVVGYPASYYTYMWSLVLAKDLFSPFQKHGLLNKEWTLRYRDKVLDYMEKRTRLERIREGRGSISAPVDLLTPTETQSVAETDSTGQLSQPGLVHNRRPHPRECPFTSGRQALHQHSGDH